MAFDFSFSDLNFENIGYWPNYLKIVVTAALCLVVIIAVYWFDTSTQFVVLNSHKKHEATLRAQFEVKQAQAHNLDIYRQQLIEMRKTFGKMLQQLPSRTEVPALLEEISKAGLASGLEFKLFDPLQEVQHDFYAELPIHMVVIGDYHQLGEFVGRVASLDRIVTLHNFKIIEANKADPSKARQKQNKTHKRANHLLLMDITAKTYRYIEGQNDEA